VKKLLIGLGVLLALLVLAALVAPSFLDWNQYKGEIADKVEAATGRRLTIDGSISLSLLPTPRLSVRSVRLANLPGASGPDLARLKALDMRVAFAPLLAGRIQIESLDLVEPQVTLERLADGRANWQMAPSNTATLPPPAPAPGAPTGAPAGGGTTGAAPAGGMGAPLPPWLQLDRVTVENGILTYRDAASGKLYTLKQINGGLNASPPSGPFRAQGRAVAQGVPLGFDVSLERLGGSRPAGFGLKVSLTGGQLDFTGTVAQKDDVPVVAGKLRFNGVDLRAMAVSFGLQPAELPNFLARSFGLEGTVATTGGGLSVTGLDFRLGETEATGTFKLEPGTPRHAALNLAVNRIDLDQWLAFKGSTSGGHSAAGLISSLRGGPPAPEKGGDGGAKPAEAGAQAMRFTLPADLAGSLDATVDAVVYKGGVVRQVRFSAGLKNAELALNQLSAELPGGSDLTIFGALRTPAGQPSFTGNLEGASDNFRGLLDWLKIDVSQIPAERLRKLVLNASLQVNPRQLQLRDVDINLDSSHVVGGATILLQDRPAFGASVAIDRLNLDAYLPQPAASKAGSDQQPAPDKDDAAAGKAAASKAAPASEPFRLLDSFDANIRARADELIYRGQSIRGLRLDGTVQGGGVTLREARVEDLAGIKGQASGSLAGLPDQPKLDLAVDLKAAELATFMRFVGAKSPISADQLGAAALKGRVKGGLDKLAVDLDGGLAGGSYKLAGTVGLGPSGVSYDLDVAAKQPQLGRVVRFFVRDAGAGDLGPLELSGHVKGDESALAVSGLKASSTLLDATGDLAVTGYPAKPAVKANLTAASRRPAALAALFGVEPTVALGQLGTLQAQLVADGDASGGTLDANLSASGASLSLAGKIANTDKGPSYDLSIKAWHPDLAALMRMFGYRPAGEKLGAFALSTKAVGGADKLALADLQATLGPTSVTGTAEAAIAGPRPKVTATLRASALDLNPLLPAAGNASDGKPRPRGQGVTGINPRWSTEPLQLAAFKSADVTLSFGTPALTYGQYKIENAKLAATLANGVLDLSGLTGKLYGGDLKIVGKLDTQAEPKATGSLRLDGADLAQAGLRVGTVRLASGTLAAAADLATSGVSEAALVHGLNGKGSLRMQGGVIQGLDLGTINARLAKLESGLDLLRLVQGATSGGETKVKSLTGTFTMKDGVAKNDDLALDAEGATGKGQGYVDLPRWYMEYDVSFKLNGAADAPPFAIKLKGAPDDPRKFLNANELQSWLINRGVGSIIKGLGKKGGQTGSGQTGTGTTPAPAQPKAPSPEDIIKNLLKQFEKKN
jgi:uncharacterized protein involved in outer membrane biogenesis